MHTASNADALYDAAFAVLNNSKLVLDMSAFQQFLDGNGYDFISSSLLAAGYLSHRRRAPLTPFPVPGPLSVSGISAM